MAFFISTTSGHLHEAQPTLQRLITSTSMRPKLVFVGIDERRRVFKWLQATPAWMQRLCGVLIPWCRREALGTLEALATRLHDVAIGAPVLVERIYMSSCTGRLLARQAFGCNPWLAFMDPRCWTPFFDKNTVSYLYGLLRLRACARYIVHIDPDQSIVPSVGEATAAAAWVHLAVRLLGSNPRVYAIMVSSARGRAACRLVAPAHHNSSDGVAAHGHGHGTTRCVCHNGNEITPQYNGHSNPAYFKVVGAHALHVPPSHEKQWDHRVRHQYVCGEVVAGHVGPHFSCQAFVVDIERMATALWPLPIRWNSADLTMPGGPLGHIEALLERAGMLAAAQNHSSAHLPLFLPASELGVGKR